ATLASSIKRDLSGMQKWLFVGAVVILLAALGNIFLQIPALMLTISVLALVIFSAFMLVDLQRIVNGGETNYVSATLAVYLDVYNVFADSLMPAGIFGGDRGWSAARAAANASRPGWALPSRSNGLEYRNRLHV